MSKRCVMMIITGIVIGIVFMGLIPAKTNIRSVDKLVLKAEKDCKKITADELNALMTSDEVYTLIDVRQELEHYYGYIPGSVILPRGSLEFKIEDEKFWEESGVYKPEKNEKIVVYCHKGQRGILAAQVLQLMGYSNVFYLDDGFKKWELTYPDNVEKNLEALGGGGHEEKSGGC
jgi:rhodanese-related sulfurtransferase